MKNLLSKNKYIRPLPWIAVFIIILFSLGYLFSYLGIWTTQIILEKGTFKHQMGYCYTFAVSYPISPHRSKLILYEDGKTLGPAKEIHMDIREKGHGRYSHWDNLVYFSASDNSDPNTNNKKYMLRHPVVIPSSILIPVALILLIILLPVIKKYKTIWMYLLKLFFLLGLFLSALNISNLFMSIRHPDLLFIMDRGKDDITLDYRKAFEQIPRSPGESDKAYVFRVNDIVNRSMANIKVKLIHEANLMRVSIRENYVLSIYNLIYSDKYKMYEYLDYRKALERGVGLCSQQAMAMTAILNENGVKAEMIGLDGHVILRAKVDVDTWYTADPDYGVVLPFDISEIENDPSVIIPYYNNMKTTLKKNRVDLTPQVIKKLLRFYTKEGNEVFQDGVTGFKGKRARDIERLSYIAAWTIPLILCLPYLLAISLLRIRTIIQRHTNR
jgi:hypothetical protein